MPQASGGAVRGRRNGIVAGTYLGGIRTIDDLRDRCYVDSDTQCWHWRMGESQGVPRVHILKHDGKRTAMRGRRAALYLSLGPDAFIGAYVWGRKHCKCNDCVNPAHAQHGSRKQWGMDMQRRGVFVGLPAKVRAARASAEKRRVLTDEQVAGVLASQDSIAKTARQFDVSRIVIENIRKRGGYAMGEIPGASAFSWRPN